MNKEEIEKLIQEIRDYMRQYMNAYPYSVDEDVEKFDLLHVHLPDIGRYMDHMYPDFEPEVVYGFDKEYYLPALKVLDYWNGSFYSPSRTSEWKDGELIAYCLRDLQYASMFDEQDIKPHEAPHEMCTCGIYGSVNLEEIAEYLIPDSNSVYYPPSSPSTSAIRNRHLCIVEPYPEAKVIRTRKGWKASHAFISEIVGQTIPVPHVNELLSMAWKRRINIRRIYENR